MCPPKVYMLGVYSPKYLEGGQSYMSSLGRRSLSGMSGFLRQVGQPRAGCTYIKPWPCYDSGRRKTSPEVLYSPGLYFTAFWVVRPFKPRYLHVAKSQVFCYSNRKWTKIFTSLGKVRLRMIVFIAIYCPCVIYGPTPSTSLRFYIWIIFHLNHWNKRYTYHDSWFLNISLHITQQGHFSYISTNFSRNWPFIPIINMQKIFKFYQWSQWCQWYLLWVF